MARTTNTKIGKNVIESLTQGMYEDSRFIFREYIQNSADQIDKAVDIGILSNREEGNIFIDIDKSNKQIIIEDNATGIESENVSSILKNIAMSTKDRLKDKGFRGIGRLGGLAYCDELIFETSYKDESKKSTFIWDALKLRNLINNKHNNEDASQVIDEITSLEINEEEPEKHYFKVTLKYINNELLLDRGNIRQYLSMVAPVPYNSTTFRFSKTIYEFVKSKNLSLDEYKIFVNDEEIRKPYTTYLYDNRNSKYDEITGIELFEIKDKESYLAWGWIGLSSFNGVIIGSNNLARGIRLRKHNIQIGSEDCLEKFFREKRGNSYFVGEIHAINPSLTPNSRRDFFVENEIQFDFASQLKKLFGKKFHEYYHLASEIRSNIKTIKKVLDAKQEIDTKEKNGYKSKDEKINLENKFAELKDNAKKAEIKLVRSAKKNTGVDDAKNNILKTVIKKETEEIRDTFNVSNGKANEVIENLIKISEYDISPSDDITDDLNKNKILGDITIDENKVDTIIETDPLRKLNKDQRKLLDKIFGIIRDILYKEMANNLIEKIIEKLK